MNDAAPITLIVVGLLIVGGVALGIACLWWRIGRSPAARWWVRTTPVEEQRTYPASEAVALVLAPVAAETMIAFGAFLAVVSRRAPLEGAELAVTVAAAVAQIVVWLIARGMTGYRWLLPLWVYPAWLRDERRRDRELLAHGG